MGNGSNYSIRTSDRRTFRRCMRKWDFQSSLRQNLTREGTEQNINFWFGSAIHYAMEDYYGWNQCEDPRRALYAYYNSFKESERPANAEPHYKLGLDMLTYYLQWIERHNKDTGFETLWLDNDTNEPAAPFSDNARPAVEISFYIPLYKYVVKDVDTGETLFTFSDSDGEEDINYDREFVSLLSDVWSPDYDADTIYTIKPLRVSPMEEDRTREVQVIGIFYHGTIDRIVVDKYGRYWLWDWKTAKSADVAKLDTDDQVSAYLWAATKVFSFPIHGFVYLQMTKESVKAPKRLKNGELSTDKRQKTTYGLLRQEIIADYGSVQNAPSKLVDFLNTLAALEEPEGDKFIRWDFVKRTPEQINNTSWNIYGELDIMLKPGLVCYPTPTRDCIWDCPFRDACVMMDKDDFDNYNDFMRDYIARPRSEDGNKDEWREHLKWTYTGEDGLPELISMDTVLDSFEMLNPHLEDTSTDAFKYQYEENC
ncbi:MAG: PD-(D/E)XK nuclease family protein [Eubacteriales bacterium]